ncbi:Uncharacterized protein C24H6.11c [Durusdinium trenchii]|uniref:Uncharacterized protein C24H6.11c n=1 Tax=Durusdinium trenchii TaxID=1381693 RepID=A0ABP0K9H5_9DINO
MEPLEPSCKTWDVSTLISPNLQSRRRRLNFRSAKSLSLPLLPLSADEAKPERTSQVRALHADTLVVEACQAPAAPEALLGRARLVRNVFAALVACFMGATDGLSLGGLLFPSSPTYPNHDYQALGMSIGLLTTLVANAGSLMGSEIKFGVAGASIPTVIILAEYFKTLGPAKCATIYTMAAICTVLIGGCVWLVGHLRLARLVKACPFVIYGGFMAGTGAVLLQYALNLMTPGFASLVELGSYTCLFELKCLHEWLPGCLAGIGMFTLRARNVKLPYISQDLLIPSILLAEAGVFFLWMLVSGTGLEAARGQGLLFPVQMPQHPVFYRIWTQHWQSEPVDWQEFLSPTFWLTVVNAACISALTAVMNIFGTASSTQIRVDIDQEMMLHGIYNMGSGLLSGLSANMVMSFSITCRTLGADGQQFQILLFIFSCLVFVSGDYVVAVLPKLLPGSVLVWLSLELMAFWVWDSLRFLRAYEYCLVWVMILMYVILGTAPMMLFGFISVAGIVQAQLATIPVLGSRQTLGKLRSPRLHTTCDREYLNRAEVWRLRTAYLYFASMRQIVQALEHFSQQRHVSYRRHPSAGADDFPLDLPEFSFSHVVSCEARAHPEYIILDLELVSQMESTAISAFQEVLSVANELGCSLILANVDESVYLQMRSFGLPILDLQDQIPTDASALLMANTVEDALEMVEDAFLRKYQPAPGHCRGHTHFGIRSKLASSVNPCSPLFGVWLDFHVWLESSYESYKPELLAQLEPFLEIRHLKQNDLLYEAPHFRHSHGAQGAWMTEAAECRVPLVWLLQGGVDHLWNPHSETEQSVRAFQDMHRLTPKRPFEKARITETTGSWCAGPFSTMRAFLAQTAHPGTLIATDASTVAILRQEKYDELSTDLRKMLNAYLLRQWPIYVRT